MQVQIKLSKMMYYDMTWKSFTVSLTPQQHIMSGVLLQVQTIMIASPNQIVKTCRAKSLMWKRLRLRSRLELLSSVKMWKKIGRAPKQSEPLSSATHYVRRVRQLHSALASNLKARDATCAERLTLSSLSSCVPFLLVKGQIRRYI